MSVTGGRLLSVMRRAVSDYSMISEGDKIAVGLSGGKDSLTLLWALAAYKKFSPQKFDLCAVTVDLGFAESDFTLLKRFCEEIDVPYYIEQTQIAQIIFEARKESHPCSLCSKMRRGVLNTTMNKLGYNKLALGHHGDDVIETFLLSLFYEGRLSTFAPLSFMDRTAITLIRPFIYAAEKDIAAVSRDFPVMHNPCPANHVTRREDMKNLIKALQKDNPAVRDRILGAITHPERNNLWDKIKPDN